MHPIARLKGMVLRAMCPLFFKRIGRRVYFHGRLRLPKPLRNVVIGDDCHVGDAAMFHTSRTSQIVIGDNCAFNSGCHIVSDSSITIGNNVFVGEFVSIRDSDHRFTPDTGVVGQGYAVDPVVIEDNVWIGRGVLVARGAKIGRGSIVAANSVVRNSFPPGVLLAGAPAVIKKYL